MCSRASHGRERRGTSVSQERMHSSRAQLQSPTASGGLAQARRRQSFSATVQVRAAPSRSSSLSASHLEGHAFFPFPRSVDGSYFRSAWAFRRVRCVCSRECQPSCCSSGTSAGLRQTTKRESRGRPRSSAHHESRRP